MSSDTAPGRIDPEEAPGNPGAPEKLAARRRRAFVDAARAAFFESGYAGATMSSIANSVGGSKTTLWSHFASKELLFAAVVDDIIARYGRSLDVAPSPGEDLVVMLRKFGHALIDALMSDDVLSLYRLVISEAGRFPHLAALFYERGARHRKVRLAHHLEMLMMQGELRKGDPSRAATQFLALCHGEIVQLALLNIPGSRDRLRCELEVETAIDTFIHAWRRR